MDKQQILSFIEEQVVAGKISKQDLLSITGQSQSATISEEVKKETPTRNLTSIFYAIGAIIVIIGVVILIVQNWAEIGFTGRILVTLGISVATYIAGFLFMKPEQRTISQVMFTMSAALAPLGVYVLLSEAGVTFDINTQLAASAVLFIIFTTALLISKKNILILISAGFATAVYYELIIKVLAGDEMFLRDLFKWASMLLGAAYLLIGYGFMKVWLPVDASDEKEKNAIQNIFYGLGTLAILGAGIMVGGYFDLIFIAFIFAAFYGSVYLKSRSMLLGAALFLMAHIIKLTAEYFVDSIGWPVALIVVGFLVIGVGYMTYHLNRKFISIK